MYGWKPDRDIARLGEESRDLSLAADQSLTPNDDDSLGFAELS